VDAILIGCNYIGSSSELEHCAADVGRIYDLIKKDLKWKINKVYLGIEDETKFEQKDSKCEVFRPDYDSTMAVLKKVLGQRDPNKFVYLHFSGHGVSVTDLNGDEEDGKDEGLMTCDEKCIIDDELQKLIHEDSNVFCTFDCCHSGTMFDIGDETPGRILTLSGARDSEKAMEMCYKSSDGTQFASGALTYTFGRVMKELATQGLAHITDFEMIKNKMQELVDKYDLGQHIVTASAGETSCLASFTTKGFSGSAMV